MLQNGARGEANYKKKSSAEKGKSWEGRGVTNNGVETQIKMARRVAKAACCLSAFLPRAAPPLHVDARHDMPAPKVQSENGGAKAASSRLLPHSLT